MRPWQSIVQFVTNECAPSQCFASVHRHALETHPLGADQREWLFDLRRNPRETRPVGGPHRARLRKKLLQRLGLDACTKHPRLRVPSDPDDGLLFQDPPGQGERMRPWASTHVRRGLTSRRISRKSHATQGGPIPDTGKFGFRLIGSDVTADVSAFRVHRIESKELWKPLQHKG